MVSESSYRTIDCIHFNIVISVLLAPRQLCRLFWVVKAGHGFLSQPCFLSIGFWIRDLASERIKSSLSVAVWGARGCSCNSLRVWMAQGKGNMISIVSLLPCLTVCAPPLTRGHTWEQYKIFSPSSRCVLSLPLAWTQVFWLPALAILLVALLVIHVTLNSRVVGACDRENHSPYFNKA